ncbi:MAG: GTP-dependent dephospho-CoA kinase family protein [Candidatus Aenigmatarchaeota archaeon]
MSEKKIPQEDLRLKEEQREGLKRTLGKVVEGKLPIEYTERRPMITVGDVVTDTLLEQGIRPDLSVIDHKTRRGRYEGREEHEAFDPIFELKNPPETITREAWDVVQQALENDEPTLIEVEGEEDLLSLVAIALCPPGGVVLYGVPSEGMVINEVSKDLKEKAWEVINNMIEVDEGR